MLGKGEKMNKLIILNHKMSLLYDDLYNYIQRLDNIDANLDLIVFPSSLYLEAFINNSSWPIGAQNMHYSTSPNHTGEISSDQLKSLGIEYVLVGHHERVSEFKENGTIVNEKLLASLDANLIPVLCFGENLDEDYREVIPRQLDAYLKDVQNIKFIIFAYEPVYASTSGTLPSPKKIEEVVSFITDYLDKKYHDKAVILYGGSVDSTNVDEIINIANLSGVLVGSISSDIREVEKIIKKI